ncbi:MAG: NUDIX domain-containing protein [Caulobacterales bacterium]
MSAVVGHGVVEKSDRAPLAAIAGPQFGEKRPGLDYSVRAGAHGILRDEQGLIALVRIGAAKGFIEHDLPGGGVDPGEAEQDALVREFMEETGLQVRAGRLIARVGQYWCKDDVTPRDSQFSIYETFIAGPPGVSTEPNHILVWTTPEDAMLKVRHEAHAWAIRQYLRS